MIVLKALEINLFISVNIILLRNVMTTFFYLRICFSRLFLKSSFIKTTNFYKKDEEGIFILLTLISPFILIF
jgi:hypothetical protein